MSWSPPRKDAAVPRKPTIAPRKPPERQVTLSHLDVKGAERFVSGASESPDSKTPKRSDVQRRDGRTLRRLTAYLDAQTFRSLSVRCAEEDKDISEALEEGARLWLARAS
jgi:hypothetical protein